MKKTILIFMSMFLYSCKENSLTITLQNKSKVLINSLKVTNGFNEIYFDSLKNNEIKKENLFFNSVKNDGNYSLYYRMKNKSFEKKFGYFSNGMPLENEINITFFKDTVIISSKS